ncbi:hypothetical protein BH24ACT6_BH24ACT6_07810 [soil metagenome]
MNAPFTTLTATARERLVETLDRLERDLPALPASWLRLNRTVARASVAQAEKLNDTFTTTMTNLVSAGRTSSNTVVGQARAASDQVISNVVTGVRQVVGQSQAQSRRFGDVAGTETSKLASQVRRQATDVASAVEDTATKNVKTAVRAAEKMADDATATAKNTTPKTVTSHGRGYASWTKSDLLDRAQELDIEGRTTMKKNELIKALRAAN